MSLLSQSTSNAMAQKMVRFSKHHARSILSISSTKPRQQNALLTSSFHTSHPVFKPKKPSPASSGRVPPRYKFSQQKKSPSQSAETTTISTAREPLRVDNIDPQQMASEFIHFSAARKQGSESVQELTQTQKLQNYGLALSLVGFVTWVWYYSMTSVGRAEGGMEQLLSEAQDARDAKERKSIAEREVEELVNAEMSLGSLDSADEAMGGKGLVVAVAAPDDIARKEEERNLEVAASRNKGAQGGRPLWKKVVFFWRRE